MNELPKKILAILILGIGMAGCATHRVEQAPPPAADSVPADAHVHHPPGEAEHHGGHEGHEPPAAGHHITRDAHESAAAASGAQHEMWMRAVGGGWQLMGMGQLFPIVTIGSPFDRETPLHRTEWSVTQPAAMLNLESPGGRVTLRTTLNFEGITLRDGELNLGGWGEGFIDSRHPHTLLHEAMLSLNLWDVAGGAFSLSAGKGFAPYGTDDPMARPVLKYPTNHHLSQILERWTVNGIYLLRGWSLEAGIFGGSEPTSPYDLSNIRSFPDSWSTRVTRRFGDGFGPLAPWEVSASYARVNHAHDTLRDTVTLINAAVRHARRYAVGDLYGLVEASRSRHTRAASDFSLLAETQLTRGRHQPYYRVEYATRPEFSRDGVAGEDEFFRYDYRRHPIGGTRWRIHSLGYGYQLGGSSVSGRPFVELQHHRIWWDRGFGSLAPERLFRTNSVWSLSAGMRLYFGGGPMRMGSYGILDPMSVMHRGMEGEAHHGGEEHPHHH